MRPKPFYIIGCPYSDPMFLKAAKNKKGVTLLELVVAVALFSFTIISATRVFKVVIDGQRDAVASQDMQESIRYTFERMAKEIRMANKDETGSCTGIIGKVYADNPFNDELSFLNYKDECITYFSSGGRLMMTWDPPGLSPQTMPLTPQSVSIDSLRFSVDDSVGSEQSKATIFIRLEANTAIEKHKQTMDMQTTISARYYE